jgi:hypothetical protein
MLKSMTYMLMDREMTSPVAGCHYSVNKPALNFFNKSENVKGSVMASVPSDVKVS